MTGATDIKLLPLPEADDSIVRMSHWPISSECDVWLQESVQDYARANVAHATAAKDAEIERLRAEVDAVWAAMPRDARYLDPPDGGCVPLHEQVRRMAADATLADRLAEALRIAEAALADIGDADREAGDDVAWCERRAALGLRRVRDILRDHDQEKERE